MKRKQNTTRPANVCIMVAVSLVMLMGFVAVALDGGLLLDDSSRVQAATDSAALAAANSLYYNFNYNKGLDLAGAAATAAKNSAATEGFTDVVVNIPPLTGVHAGQPGFAEVIITYHQRRFFSRIFGSEDLPVRARAVGAGRWLPLKIGILVLDPTSPSSLVNNGNGAATVLGAPIIVDSNAPDAAVATGGGTVTSDDFNVVGVPGIDGSGNWVGYIHSGVPPVPDPLAYLPAPDPTTMTVQSKSPLHVSGSKTASILPGVYTGGITVSGQASLSMAPGVYYMAGGGFSFTGQGNLNAQGVTIYNAPKSNSDVININGLGSITLTPPTTGTYKGISLFQQRSSTNTMYVAGNGNSYMTGAFYVAGGTLNVQGNGDNNTIGAQYISWNLKIGGGGNFKVVWDPNLVPPARELALVE